MGDNFGMNFCNDKMCFVSGSSDGVNFEENEYANGHNEAGVGVMCDRDDWANDQFTFIAFTYLPAGDRDVYVSTNSEASVPLWNDGKIRLHYEASSNHWSMTGIADGHDWSFCEAGAVVVKLASAFRCFAIDEENDDLEAKHVAEQMADQIEMDIQYIAHNSAHYTDREDCTAPEKISKTYENLLNGLAAQDPGW